LAATASRVASPRSGCFEGEPTRMDVDVGDGDVTELVNTAAERIDWS
jgi:hypothetical protein